MATAEQLESPVSAVPPLQMMIDRTSFDVDDYGVDRAALESSTWASRDSAVPSAVVRNGKVRRRLRWRPKSMAKRRRQQRLDDSELQMSSSNASVTSQNSRMSRKSFHSFASTETQVKSNTKRGKGRKFPLPRPNYPKSFDGVATVENEGTATAAWITRKQEKASPPATFDVADTDDLSLSEDEATIDTSKDNSSGKKTNTSRRTGFPPLFKRRTERDRAQTIRRAASSVDSFKGDEVLRKSVSMPISPYDITRTRSDPTGLDDLESVKIPESESPMPALSGEELEGDRRCDLRVRTVLTAEGRDSSESVRDPRSLKPSLSFPVRSQSVVTPLSDRDFQGIAALTPKAMNSRTPSTPSSLFFGTAMNNSLGVLKSYSSPMLSESAGAQMPLQGTPVHEDRVPSPTPSESTGVLSFQTESTVEDGNEDEWRFSMSDGGDASLHSPSDPSSVQEGTPSTCDDERTPPAPLQKSGSSSKISIGPVDLDDGSFLEVEKNLQAIHDMASEHLQHNEYAEAREVFEEILRGQLARYGKDHFRVGTAYHNIGVVSMRQGSYVDAIRCYKESVRVRKLALGADHPDVGASIAQLGVAYMECKRHRKAIIAFREALRIRRLCYGNKHPKTAKILNNIGAALYELDELEVAMVAFEEALEIQRGLLRDSPVESVGISENSLLSIASTQSNISSIKLLCGQFDEARVGLEEALLIQQCVLGDEHLVAKRTQDSLEWLETTRASSSGDLTGNDRILCRSRQSTKAKPNLLGFGLFESLGRTFFDLPASFQLTCGAQDNASEAGMSVHSD